MRLIVALVVLIVVGGATALYLSRRGAVGRPVDIQLGQAIFTRNCAACHGPAAEGLFPAPPLNFTGHAHHHPDWELYRVIADGKVGFGEMPAWKGRLDDHEIRSVIVYIKTLWAADQRRFQDHINEVRPTPP